MGPRALPPVPPCCRVAHLGGLRQRGRAPELAAPAGGAAAEGAVPVLILEGAGSQPQALHVVRRRARLAAEQVALQWRIHPMRWLRFLEPLCIGLEAYP